MKANNAKINKFRVRSGKMAGKDEYGNNGAFLMPGPNHDGCVFTVIASDQEAWDHVSVSLPDRCPTWQEMCHFKDVFFEPDEWVIQYHPAKSKYVNNHDYVLHLWRPQMAPIPIPPQDMV